jgi:apolipoprotein N-acyltransferase
MLKPSLIEPFKVFLSYLWIGGLSTLSFAPFYYTHLVWFAPLGLFWLEERYSGQYKKLIRQGMAVSIVFCAFSFFWINHMLTTFGNLPLPVALFLFLLYSVLANLKFSAFLVLFSFFKNNGLKRNFLLPGFSILFSEFFTYQIFPWYFGNLVAGNTILSQVVEYTGVYGLSFLSFVVSFGIYECLKHYKYIIKLFSNRFYYKHVLYFLYPFFTLAIFFIFGYILFQKWNNISPVKYKNILMVQPDPPLEFRDGRSFKETMEDLMNRIEKLVKEGSKENKPDLIILPESSVPFYSAHNTVANTEIDKLYWYRFEGLVFLLAQNYKSNVFFNEVDTVFVDTEQSPKNLRYINNSVLYDPNGSRGDSYSKSYLLAFGEYIPFGEKFPVLYNIIPQIGRFLPGAKQNLIRYYTSSEIPFSKKLLDYPSTEIFTLPVLREYYKENYSVVKDEGQFLPLICYEVILPEFVRKFAVSGNPDFIVNITNDKWYGKYLETYQHLELARLRSIEYRRWMVRSTNSGTSAFVDHLGRIVDNKMTDVLSTASYMGKVGVMQSEPTFYMRFGNLLCYIFMTGYSLLYLLILRKK